MAIEMTAAPDVTARNVEGQGAIETIVSHEPDKCAPAAQFITPQQQCALGWDIFPMGPNVKGAYPVPWSIAKGWKRLDADSVDHYWPDGSTQHFNVGVPTGARSGVWVLDVDRVLEEESEAREYVAEWTGIEIPDTLSVKTASGKWHFYFAMPEDPTIYVKNSRGELGDLIDVRGDGGMVMGICSAVVDEDGERNHYQVVRMTRPAQAPAELIERVKRRETPKSEIVPASIEKDVNDAADAIAAGWIEEELQRLRDLPRPWVAGSGWHDTCFEVSCKLSEFANSSWCSLTPEEAQRRYFEAAPGVENDWNPATEWREGVQKTEGQARKMPNVGLDMSWFDDVPTKGELRTEAKAAHTASVVEAASRYVTAAQMAEGDERTAGWACPYLFTWDEDKDTWKGNLDVEEARQLVVSDGEIARDPAGGSWTYQHGVYVLDNDVLLDRVYRMLGGVFSNYHLANIRSAVRAMSPSLDLTKAPDPSTMNFRNGLLAWESGDDALRAHDPANLLTVQFPYNWNPKATCPQFDHWMSTMLEPDQIPLAWKILGYMMLSGNPLQVAIMLYGDGSNGKSTFLKIAQRLVGEDNVSAVALKDFGERFATTDMIGKIANIVGDIDAGYQVSTAALKQATGGDPLRFERKSRDGFSATLWATCIFSANKIPGTNDRSDGYAERWVPLNFKRKASEYRIEGFSEEALWAEIQGIAAKAVRALREVPLHQGADRNKAFDLSSASSVEALEHFRESSNSYYEWIKNHVIPSETDVAKPKELWAIFKDATGSKHRGSNCPPDFQKVLTERFGSPTTVRGRDRFGNHDAKILGYKVAVLDSDDPRGEEALFGSARADA